MNRGNYPARWLALARRLFIPVALAFLAVSAYRASDSLGPLLAELSWAKLLVACLAWGSAQWVGPIATVGFARIFGIPLGYRALALISVLRLPAKYLPGGIWQSVARFAAYRQHDVRNRDSLAILTSEHVVALAVSLALGGGILLSLDNSPMVTRIAALALACGVALILLCIAWLARRPSQRIRKLGWMVLVVFATVLFWCLAAVAFALYWSALFPVSPGDIPRLVSCYLLSWAAGFAAVFAPQGLGVFEWVAAHLLPSMQTLSVTVTAVAGFRLVAITGDLVAWLTALAISQTKLGRSR